MSDFLNSLPEWLADGTLGRDTQGGDSALESLLDYHPMDTLDGGPPMERSDDYGMNVEQTSDQIAGGVVVEHARTGRGGTKKCGPCRSSHKLCFENPEDPEGPCKSCKGKDVVCERTWPPKKFVRSDKANGTIGQTPNHASALALVPRDHGDLRAILRRLAILEAKVSKVDTMETRLSQCECTLSFHPFGARQPLLPNPVRPRPSQSVSYPIASAILEIVHRAGIPVEPAGYRIAETIERHFRNTNTSITTLRAKPFLALGGILWPVVEWKQGDETDAFAIFIVENTRLPLSHIMHFGDGMVYQKEGNCFKKSSIRFQAANMQDFGRLLRATQSVLKVPQSWSMPEMPTDCLPEELSDERKKTEGGRLLSSLLQHPHLEECFDTYIQRLLKLFGPPQVVKIRESEREMLCASVNLGWQTLSY